MAVVLFSYLNGSQNRSKVMYIVEEGYEVQLMMRWFYGVNKEKLVYVLDGLIEGFFKKLKTWLFI